MSSNLAQDQIYQLFGNITQLLPFHKAFSEKLKALQEQHAGEAIPGIGAVVKEGMLGIRSPAYAMFTSNQNTALEMYGSLDMISDHFSRVFQLHTTPHLPPDMLYVPVLIGC